MMLKFKKCFSLYDIFWELSFYTPIFIWVINFLNVYFIFLFFIYSRHLLCDNW